MTIFKKSFLAGALVSLLGTSVLIADVPDLTFTNIRQMGMGSAGVAVNNGDADLYQNPALLSEVKDPYFKFPRFQAAIGTDVFDKKDTLNKLKDSSEAETGQILVDLTPLKIAAGAGLSTVLSYTSPGFGVGVFSGSFAHGALEDVEGSISQLTLYGVADVAPALGFTHKVELFNQPVELGISGKYIVRNTMYDNVTGVDYIKMGIADLTYAINNDKLQDDLSHTYSSTGFGVDIGMLTPIELWGAKGNFGLAVRNIGATLSGQKTLTGNVTVDSTQTLPVTAVMGVSFKSDVPFLGEFLTAADYKLSPGTTFFKSLSMGFEKQVLGDVLKVRSGLNQGYFVMGIGLDLAIFHLDYAYQAIELGSEAGQDPLTYHVLEMGFLF